MRKQNLRYRIEYPKLLMRMAIVATSLPVAMKVKEGLLTKDCFDQMMKAFRDEAKRLGVDPDMAEAQLQTKALLQFALTEDEEKNSSSPLSDTTSPEQSAKNQSSGPQTEADTSSSAPVTSDEDTGSISSE
jgi:hypothetical protein